LCVVCCVLCVVCCVLCVVCCVLCVVCCVLCVVCCVLCALCLVLVCVRVRVYVCVCTSVCVCVSTHRFTPNRYTLPSSVSLQSPFLGAALAMRGFEEMSSRMRCYERQSGMSGPCITPSTLCYCNTALCNAFCGCCGLCFLTVVAWL